MTSWLRRRGIAFLFANTNEFAGAITKPARGEKFRTYRQGASNAGQYAASLNIDWEMLAGLKGLATHMITTGRYGTTANRMFGDWLNHSSEDYGGAGNVAVHLVMLYAEENLFGNRLAIAGGRMAELSDFAASELFCNFMNGSICGRPKEFQTVLTIQAIPQPRGPSAYAGDRPVMSTCKRASILRKTAFIRWRSTAQASNSTEPISSAMLCRLKSGGNQEQDGAIACPATIKLVPPCRMYRLRTPTGTRVENPMC